MALPGHPRSLFLGCLLLVGACSKKSDSPAAARHSPDARPEGSACAVLFGKPSDKTGLGPDQCRPECACGTDSFSPPNYDAAFIQSLVDGWELSTPYSPLATDPYASPPAPDDPAGTVCGVLPDAPEPGAPRPYRLLTYGSEREALAAGAHPTHFGHCGVCSTLSNLAVYMKQNDLAGPVRACGLIGIADGGNANLACLQALGFDLPCAQVWYFNTVHTRDACLGVCISLLDAPYQLPDGGLNACIQCDEDQSGPVFKAVAGRTRRNSGLPNALCRPCSEVQPLVHAY